MQLRTTKKQKNRDIDIGYDSQSIQNNKKYQNEKDNHSLFFYIFTLLKILI